MLKKLYPTAYYKQIYDIPLSRLKKKGINALVLDIDNTLSPHDCPEPDNKIIAFIDSAVTDGFTVCLLSNNSKKRVSVYNKKLNINAVHFACKPLGFGLKRAMKLIGSTKRETVLIGDQIFTDVLCGNFAGVRTVLVSPCSERDQWITKVKRRLEKIIVDKYLESRVKNNERQG